MLALVPASRSPRRDLLALSLPNPTLPLFVLLVGALAYLKYGPSEKNNVNANTSGVAALLRHRRAAHAALPQRRVRFLFLTAAATICGAPRVSASAIRRALGEASVLCLDCGGSVGRRRFRSCCAWRRRQNGELLDATNLDENPERKTCYGWQ